MASGNFMGETRFAHVDLVLISISDSTVQSIPAAPDHEIIGYAC